MIASKNCIHILKYYEQLHDGDLSVIGLQPKMDPKGIWTEGYGHAMIDPRTGKFLCGKRNESYARKIAFINDPCIEDEVEAERLLKIDLGKTVRQVNKAMVFTLNQNQFDAVVDFVYNLGIGSFLESTMYRLMKLNPNNPNICKEFVRFIKCGGVPLIGLVRRRLADDTLYFK